MSVGAGQQEWTGSEDSVPLVFELGSTLFSQNLATWVQIVLLTRVQAAVPNCHIMQYLQWSLTGNHPSSNQIYMDGCEGVFKILQALHIGKRLGVILLLIFF